MNDNVTHLDVICHVLYRKIEGYRENFFEEMINKVRNEHFSDNFSSQWNYIGEIIKNFLSYDIDTNLNRELFVFFYFLSNEKSLREKIREDLLRTDRYQFYINEWEQYLFDQTDILKRIFTQDVDKAIMMYSDSLCESWILQEIPKKIQTKNQNTNKKKRQPKKISNQSKKKRMN